MKQRRQPNTRRCDGCGTQCVVKATATPREFVWTCNNAECGQAGGFISWAGSEPPPLFDAPARTETTNAESAGPRPNKKGKAAMERKREQLLLENAVPVGNVISRVLVCELTLDEQRERGAELASAMTAETELAAEKKEVLNNFKAREQQLAIKTGQLHQVVETRREFREVDCHEYHDYKAGKVYVVRDDLGTIPETRNMTATERQQQLPRAEKVSGETKTDATGNSDKDKKKTRQATRSTTATA